MRTLRFLILTVFLIIAGTSPAWTMGDPGFVQQTMVGKQAADFTLRTVKDRKIDLAQDTRGTKTILLFWTTWCPYCRVAVKEINAVKDKIAAKNITVIFVSVGEPEQVVERYLQKNGYDLDVALDEDQSVSDAYRLMGVPTVVYIDEHGTIKSVENGFSSDYMERFK